MEKTYDFYPFTFPKEKGDKWVYKNRCVLRIKHDYVPKDAPAFIKEIMGESHMCGYVVLPKSRVPREWWGEMSAPGLSRLAIHGNLTYCDVEGDPNQERIRKEIRDRMERLHEKYKEISKDKTELYFKERMGIKEWEIKQYQDNDEGYVVFGFDCNHHSDHKNKDLQDPNHVMMLTEQMEQQLLAFADVYQEYKDAEKVPATKDIVQTTIIRNIRREAELKTQMGLGGMLDILSGEVPPDDLPI